MQTINKFSNEVTSELNYYVYRLIDPRNGLTFYVGKGKNNRAFDHINGVLKDNGGNSYLELDENLDSLKVQIIKEIQNSGLEVMLIIHRWGMDKKTAFEVEATLIDAYSNLCNLVKGHHTEYGVCNALELQNRLAIKEYQDSPQNPRYIIIKTSITTVDNVKGKTFNERLYNATRHCWKISLVNAKKCPYILAVIDGIVREVFEVENWILVEDSDGRYEFNGHIAKEEIRQLFKGFKIPSKYRKRGQASPILYSKS